MSTKSAVFLVQMPDEPSAQRAKYLAEHMAIMENVLEAGDICTTLYEACTHTICATVAAGGFLPDEVKMTGYFAIIHADPIPQVWDILKKDPFHTSGEVSPRSELMTQISLR
ncbi:hypothetical protein C8Q80DRAFT_1267925 [Daedaleopsis nitida]|nr:hypothetical protein C8Q80DRAFT_1267925 [Daedaleopsis nitida]